MEWKNERELQLDLAEYLRACDFLTFTEIQVPGCEGGRIDVAAIKPHLYSTKDLRAYEVKVTRQCFMQDVGNNKWHKYLNVFNRVYFAVPEGIVKKEDVPKDAGLIVRNDNGWHVVKAARGHRPENMTVDAVFSLLYRGYEESLQMRRLSERIVAEENVPLRDKARLIGHEIARRLDRDRESQVEYWAKEVAEIINNCLGIELEFEKNGELRLPSTWSIEESLKSIGKVTKEYETLKKIGAFLYTLGEESWRLKQVSREKVLEVMETYEKDR